jgi:hypothetical protein
MVDFSQEKYLQTVCCHIGFVKRKLVSHCEIGIRRLTALDKAGNGPKEQSRTTSQTHGF